MRLLAGGERVAGLGVIELAERHRLAGLGGAALLAVLAEELEHAGDATGIALGGDERRAVADLAVEHARDRHLAAVRGMDGLEHIGHGAAGLDPEPLGGIGDAGRFVAQRLHQPQHAVGARRRADQHRTDETLAQFLGEIVEHLVARRLDVFEQLLHQLVVVVGERLQHGEARGLLAVERVAFERDDLRRRVLLVDKGAFEREIDEAGDDLAREGRDLPQQQLVARGRLQHPEHVVDGRIGLVDLVEEQEARNVLGFELAQDELQLRDFLLVELADHDRGVDCRQRRAHIMDEFDRAGKIDEGVGVAHEIGGGDREFDAHVVIACFLAAVTDRSPRIDRTLALDRASAGKDRFEQRRLAALEWAHQRNAPWTRGSCAVLCHFRLPNSPRCGLLRDRLLYRFRPEGDLARGAGASSSR